MTRRAISRVETRNDIGEPIAGKWPARLRGKLLKIAQKLPIGHRPVDTRGTVVSTKLPAAVLKPIAVGRSRSERGTNVHLDYARLCAALDSVNANVMICDQDLKIVYVNASILDMFRRNESKIADDFPGFDAAKIVGRCVDDFHRNPAGRRAMLDNLSERFSANIRFGGEVYQIVANPVHSSSGERLGTVMEWENLCIERQREEDEKQRNQQLERILDVLGNLRLTITAEGEVTDLNPQLAQCLGYARADLLNSRLSTIMVGGLTPQAMAQLAANDVFQDMSGMLRHADGTSMPVNLFGLIERNADDQRQISRILILARPTQAEPDSSDGLHLSTYLADRVSDGVALVDDDWTILSVNRSFCDITGAASAAAIGAKLPVIMPGVDVFSTEMTDDRWEGEYAGKRTDDSDYMVMMTIHALGLDSANRLVTIKDITNLRKSEKYIRNLAYHDALTGLANRAYFEQRVEEAIKVAKRSRRGLAILFFDLDEFKDVNDSLGHLAGDQLLCTIASRISNVVRDSDIVARLGGDEFCILVENVEQPHLASNVAQKCLDAISESCTLSGRELHPMASVGITMYPDDGKNYATLLQSADSAMYAAKHAGKNRYAFYSPELTRAAQARLALEQDLRIALRNGDFELRYQPQIELATGRMVAVEALIRWQHRESGPISPVEFIPVIERMGLIEVLGEWVLDEACGQAVEWAAAGLQGLKIAVNISGTHFRRGRIITPVRQVLDKSGLDPKYLQIEVTETALQTESESLRTFTELREIGVSIAIDDFGTGYSCLNSIRRLPLDCLKIDQMFVRDLIDDHENSSIVATIIAMGRAMGLTVVAEGVEDIRQVRYLSGLGCNLVQGFYFSRALHGDDIPSLADTSFYPAKTEDIDSRAIADGRKA